jgi:hypothetical protein
MIKGYQLELNFKNEQEIESSEKESDTIDDNTVHRGSKSFIEQMARMEEQQSLFEEYDGEINDEEESE